MLLALGSASAQALTEQLAQGIEQGGHGRSVKCRVRGHGNVHIIVERDDSKVQQTATVITGRSARPLNVAVTLLAAGI